MTKRINDEQRDVSYGELVALQQEFETQLDENHVIFDDDDDYDEALNDFIQQYMDGDDDPQIDFSMAKVRPVRDSKKRVRDARGRANYEPVKRAIDEFVEEYCSDESIDDYGIINNGLGNGNGLLALADVGGCGLYVFNSEEDAFDYVVTNGYGADYLEGAMPKSEWVDYLVNGGVDRDEAERLIETEDWQGITEIIAEKEGEEWFLGSYFGEKFHVNDFVIYY